jgi:hypothetical protein
MQEACDYLLESDKVKNFSGKIIANWPLFLNW